MDMGHSDFRIGRFKLVRKHSELRDGKRKTRISPRALTVLEYLVDAGGEPVSQSRFIREVWDDNYIVGEHGLRTIIWELRKAFGDDPRMPRYIKTLPRKGYQLIQSAEPMRPWYKYPNRRAWVAAAMVAILVGGAVVFTETPSRGGAETLWLNPAPAISSDLGLAAIEIDIDGQRDLVILDKSFPDFGESLLSGESLPEHALRPITQTAGRAVSAVWAPVQRKVAWMDVGMDGQCQVRVFDERNDRLETLAQDCFELTSPLGTVPAQLDWSADGRQLAYQARIGPDSARLAVIEVDQADYPVHYPVSGPMISQALQAFPRFSDDGRLAFLKLLDPMMSRGEIHITNPRSQSLMRCPAAPIWGLAWADDDHLAITAAMNNPFELWLLDSNRGLYSRFGLGAHHLLSRRVENKLLIDRYKLISELQQVSIDGSAPPGNVKVGGGTIWLDYSAATAQYVTVQQKDDVLHLDLLNPDGSTIRLFSNTEIYAPRFSQNGGRIGFTTRAGLNESARSHMVNLENYEVTPLSSGEEPVFFAEWDAGGDWYGVRGVPAPLGTHGELVRFASDGSVDLLIADNSSLHVFKDTHGGLWWADNDGVIFHKPTGSKVPREVDRLSSVYESWTLDRRTRVLYLTESHPDQTRIRQRTVLGHEDARSLNIMRARVDHRVGLTIGPDDSLLFRRGVWSWAAREPIDIEELTSRLNPANALNGQCEQLGLPPTEKPSLVMQ